MGRRSWPTRSPSPARWRVRKSSAMADGARTWPRLSPACAAGFPPRPRHRATPRSAGRVRDRRDLAGPTREHRPRDADRSGPRGVAAAVPQPDLLHAAVHHERRGPGADHAGDGRVRVIVVTGTDTGVGKTIVSAALAALTPGAVYVKPAQTGDD